MHPSVEPARLQRNAVGLAPTLFQSITHMAPAAAVAFSIIVGVPYAGGSIPLAVLLALIACLLCAVSIGQLAKHLPSAGGLYTYSSRGLHPYVGFLVAWGFILAEPIVAPLLYLVFGNELAAKLIGWSPEVKFVDGLHRTIDWYFGSKDLAKVRSYFGRMLTERGAESAEPPELVSA